MRILIVDDDELTADVLENALTQFGYEVTKAKDGREALQWIRSGLFRMVISDWEMPEMTGLELCRCIRQRYSSSYIYTILLTARRGTQNIVDGLGAGADDFITKPFQPQELCVRIRAGERILALESHELVIFSLAKLAESRDTDTGTHLERMREYCRVIAQHLSEQKEFSDEVDGDYVQLIYMTGPLHDIGKVGIPDSILLKPGPLTPMEFEVMKQHTIIGARTLDAAVDAYPEAKYLAMARDIALTHHERYNGKGYPNGLAGDDIPLCGRIVTLADVYDALTTKRSYKPAYSHDTARDIILNEMRSHFDPRILDAFCANENRFRTIHSQFQEGEDEVDAIDRLLSRKD